MTITAVSSRVIVPFGLNSLLDMPFIIPLDANASMAVMSLCATISAKVLSGFMIFNFFTSAFLFFKPITVSAYAAAKGGLKMLTKNICSEYGEFNIQCNGIGPGYFATPQTAPLRETQPDGSKHPFDRFICAKTPAGRWLNPEGLVGPAVFLASSASDAVNGHILYVDGGILAYIGKQP